LDEICHIDNCFKKAVTFFSPFTYAPQASNQPQEVNMPDNIVGEECRKPDAFFFSLETPFSAQYPPLHPTPRSQIDCGRVHVLI
jgi:hypothetical protein